MRRGERRFSHCFNFLGLYCFILYNYFRYVLLISGGDIMKTSTLKSFVALGICGLWLTFLYIGSLIQYRDPTWIERGFSMFSVGLICIGCGIIATQLLYNRKED